MGFLTHSRLAKLTRIAALVAALSSACKSRSEQFLELVARKDRAVAAELIQKQEKETQWKKAYEALDKINNILVWQMFRKNVARLPVFSGGGFFSDLELFFRNFKNISFSEWIDELVRPLQEVGLEGTTEEQRKNLLNYFLGIDTVIADKINGESNEYVKAIDTNKSRHRWTDMRPQDAIKYLQQLLLQAKKAGFTKIVEACQNALINIRGALSKKR